MTKTDPTAQPEGAASAVAVAVTLLACACDSWDANTALERPDVRPGRATTTSAPATTGATRPATAPQPPAAIGEKRAPQPAPAPQPAGIATAPQLATETASPADVTSRPQPARIAIAPQPAAATSSPTDVTSRPQPAALAHAVDSPKPAAEPPPARAASMERGEWARRFVALLGQMADIGERRGGDCDAAAADLEALVARHREFIASAKAMDAVSENRTWFRQHFGSDADDHLSRMMRALAPCQRSDRLARVFEAFR